MGIKDEIKALFPDVINGKTHQQLLDEDTARDSAIGNHFFDGVKFPWMVQPSNLEALKTFEVRDDDVFLITYPISGTHWAMEILQLILNDGKDDIDRSSLMSNFETTQYSNRSLLERPSVIESGIPGYKIYEGMKSPRLIWGHCSERLQPPQVFTKQVKVVYVARNPKDVLMSMLKMAGSLPTEMGTLNLEEALWFQLEGRMFYGSWFDHVLDYWNHREDPNFLFLKYKDLHKDLRGCIGKLGKHVGKDLSDDVIDRITQRVSIGEMQKTYRTLEDNNGENDNLVTKFQNVSFLRKGKVGGWRNHFTVAQSALFDRMYGLKMQGTGLQFDFKL